MILILLSKAIILILGAVDAVISATLSFIPNMIGVTIAPVSIFLFMDKTALYLKAIAPYTATMIFNWLFTYFVLAFVYIVASILFSFVPRFKVHL